MKPISRRLSPAPVLAWVLSTTLVFAAEKVRVAVLPLDTRSGVGRDIAATASDLLDAALIESRRFQMVDRISLDRVLKEQAFQNSGCTESACAVKLGNIMNVERMVIGTMSRLGKKIFVQVKLVDVETATLGFAEQVFIEKEDELPEGMEILARRISERVPVTGRISSVRGSRSFEANISPADGAKIGAKGRVIRLGSQRVDEATGDLLGRLAEDLGRATLESFETGTSLSMFKVNSKARDLKTGDLIILDLPPPPETRKGTEETGLGPPAVAPGDATAGQTTWSTIRSGQGSNALPPESRPPSFQDSMDTNGPTNVWAALFASDGPIGGLFAKRAVKSNTGIFPPGFRTGSNILGTLQFGMATNEVSMRLYGTNSNLTCVPSRIYPVAYLLSNITYYQATFSTTPSNSAVPDCATPALTGTRSFFRLYFSDSRLFRIDLAYLPDPRLDQPVKLLGLFGQKNGLPKWDLTVKSNAMRGPEAFVRFPQREIYLSQQAQRATLRIQLPYFLYPLE